MLKNFSLPKFSKYLLIGFSALVLFGTAQNNAPFSALAANPNPIPSAPPTPAPACPAMTCTYSENAPTSECASGARIVTGTGVSGFNQPGCKYVSGCSQVTCASGPAPTPAPTSNPTQPPAPAAPNPFCTADISVDNSNPAPNSNVVVTISNFKSSNPSCVTLEKDGAVQSCSLSGSNVVCNVNSGSAGTTHNLEFKTGQSQAYPAGTNCGSDHLSCGTKSFSTQQTQSPMCIVSYNLSPSSPTPNSAVQVTISNIQTSNPSCVVLTQDGQVQSCHLSGSNVVCTVNSGNAGSSHTLQFKTGQSQAYPAGTNCGNQALDCNATSYTTTQVACVPNGSCSAPTPACGTTTTGVDNCGNSCTKTGAACSCTSNGSCSAPAPACGTTTSGVDNCGNVCTKTGGTCACVSDNSCSAPAPACGTTTTGVDNCGATCTKTGAACACVSDSTKCSAPAPDCGQTTTGVDNCGKVCTRTGVACLPGCTPNGSCSVQTPSACGATNQGVDNCGNVCIRQSGACAPQGQQQTQYVTINNPPVSGNLGIGTSYVAGVQYTALPKTGLPALAWSALAFIPAGFKMRRFSKTKRDLEDHPSYIFESRKFKAES